MGIFDLFRTWLGFGKRTARARRRTDVTKTETLEVRRMLTVNVSLAATTLTVAGTGGDTIEVSQNATGTDITWNGGGANFQHYGPGTTIDTINVTAGTGADTITIDEVLPTTTLTVDGGTSMSTLVSPTLANTWDITGADAGTLNGNNFTNIDSLVGGSSDDDFTFEAGGSLDGSIDGGAGGTNTLDYTNAAGPITVDLGSDAATYVTGGFVDGTINNVIGTGFGDTLIGANVINTWDISGTNSGDVNDDLGNTVTYSQISNLTGNADDDTFLFLGGSVDGTIDGGAGGTNTLDYSNTNSPMTLDLGAYSATDTGGFVDGTINNVVGSSDPTGDTIIGATASNTWQITGVNSGTVNDDLLNTVTFSAVKSLTGGALDNTFVFQDGASLDGLIDGGTGGATTLDYSNTTTGIFVDLQADTATALGLGFVDGTINNIIGSTDTTDTISSSNNTTAWTINGVDAGSTQDSFGNAVTFSNIKNLTGGTGDDTFSFMDGGSIDGAVDGGGGNNTLDYSSLTSAMSADLQNNFATGIGTTFANISLIVGTGQAGDSLIGSDSVNTWTIDGTDSGTVDNGGGPIGYQNIINLTGGASDDTYFFQDGGSVSGSISDASGFNTLDFSSLTNDLTVDLNASTASVDNGGPTTILASFNGISNLVGNDPSATLIAPDTSNIWSINGTNAGDINGTTFSGFDVLVGGALDDTFNFATTGSVTGSISGGSDTNNTIVGADQVNTWTLSGMDAGDLNGSQFTNIQNLTGGAFADNFVFMPTGDVEGNIDGSGDVNTLDYSNLNSGVTVNLQTMTAADVGGTIANITGMIGSFDVTDTLIGPDTSNVWTIDGLDSGNLNNFQFTFSGVENLTGGALDDTFAFTDTGFIENTIDGGAGSNTLDYSQMTSPVTANLNASGSTGIGVAFTNIQDLIGTGLGDTIIGNDYDNVWTIDGADSGSVVSQFASMNFQNFANLTGGALDDTFLITDAGSVSGLTDGTTGNNTLNFSQMTNALTVDLNAQSIPGIVGTFNNITNFVGNATTNSTLAGPNANNLWNITSGNSGDVNGTTFSGFMNLLGGSNDDTFAFGATGFVSGQIAGGAGTNTLDYSARTSGIVANLQAHTATAIGAGWNSIQNIVGADMGDDVLTGNNANSTWQINDAGGNAGSVSWNAITVTFSGIGNLQGGTGNDTFAFSNLGFVTGNIFGGAGTNTLDWSADPTAVTVNTQTNTATGIGGKYASIQNFIFPVGQNNTLVGSNQNNIWNITGANSGNLNGVSFNNVANLVGGSLLDTFKFAPGGFVSGTIDGSAGTNTLDYSALSSGALINLQTGAATNVGGGFSSIQNLIGSTAGDDKIVGANTANTFHITGANTGDVNSTITFSKFENLTGGAQNDAFVFMPGGFVSGAIAGGAGANNTLDYSHLTSGITANLQTNSSTNIGGGFSSIQSIIGANHGDDVLIGGNYANIWDINNLNQLPGVTGNAGSLNESVNGQAVITYFRGINNLVGGALSDWFKIETGGFVSGSIKGMAGNNALDYSSYGAAATVNMQTNAATAVGGGFASMLGVVGNTSVADTLIGFNVGNVWQVTGANTGFVNSNFGFTNFANLTGGTGIDVFSLSTGGSITGTVNGGSTGGDWLNYAGISTNVTANLTTNTATGFAHLANIQNVLGGSGSNTLTGNAQGNILVGGSGVDTITGGSGRSLLIGGLSGDTLKGGAGQDIVIGGYTNYDQSLAALNSILAEWQLTTPFQTRVAHLRTGGGLNGNVVLVANSTVHNDSAVNVIYGGAGPNWLFGQPAEFKDKTASDITDTPIDNNITVSGAGVAVYTIGQSAIPIDPTIKLSSIANNNDAIKLSYATIKLTTNYMSNQDTLTFSPTSATGNIVGAFNATTGTMTLTSAGGTATVTQFQAAIQQVRYTNSANLGAHPFAPSTLNRTVETQVFDGQRFSNTAIGTLSFNTAPTLANPSNLTYTTGQAATVISPNITVADADSTRLASATVAITTNYNSNQDRLIFTSTALTGDIVGSFNTATGVLTLTSASSIQATVAQYQAALRQVQYQNTASAPFKMNRVVTYQVSDGFGVSNKATSTITVK